MLHINDDDDNDDQHVFVSTSLLGKAITNWNLTTLLAQTISSRAFKKYVAVGIEINEKVENIACFKHRK